MDTASFTISQLDPGERVSADCLAGDREQTLRVLDGILYVVHGENETVLTPGDSVTLDAGVESKIWNAGDEVARVERRGPAAAPALRLAA
jgi:uncharacterized cupin superfamily protein